MRMRSQRHTSMRRASEKPRRANLVAEYALWPGRAAKPDMEDTMMMWPRRLKATLECLRCTHGHTGDQGLSKPSGPF